MKFLKKTVSAFLAAVTAVTMLFAGSVTAEAASDDVYVDGFYNSEGQYCLRIGKYGINPFCNLFDMVKENGECTLDDGNTFTAYDMMLVQILSVDGEGMLCMTTFVESSTEYIVTNVYSWVTKDGKKSYQHTKELAQSARYYWNDDNDYGIVTFLPKGSKHLDQLASAKKIEVSAGVYFTDNSGAVGCLYSLDEVSVTPSFEGLEKTTSSEKTDSSKDKPSTSGKLPKKAKTGTPMPEYTVKGYYTSKAKDTYEIVVGGIPEEEYEYLQACAAYFKDEGFIDVMVRSLGDYRFWFSAGISGDFSTAHLYFDSGNLAGEGKLEKSGNSYTWTLTFDLNSAAKKALEKQIKKTKTGLMEVENYYSISESGNYNSYNYYNGKNSYVSKAVRYNFSNEIKDKSSSSTEIALKATALTAKKSDGKIKLSWKKVDGAEKYQIYYREKGESKYKKLTTVSAGKTSYSTSKLDKNKTYEFKIRSYAESGGKKVYSKYSKTVTVK